MTSPETTMSEADRTKRVLTLPVSFHPYVFEGEEFPGCEFENPQLARELLGPYTLSLTYYDRDYRPVTSAKEPGRYGAVVEIAAEGRPVTRRFRTLFRRPADLDLPWSPLASPVSVEFSKWKWPAAGVAEEQAGAIDGVFWMRFRDGVERDPKVPALLAGLYEAQATGEPATPQDDVLAQDRQWWVGLKRKLYGMEEAYPATFMRPVPKEGAPAPTLRPGTEGEAGLRPGAVAELDQLLKEWASDTDQAFAVCLARHGVIYLHQGYGQREGRPMAVTDKSWVASITKLLSGCAIMMCVDAGLVDLDDPVEKYLPAFRGVSVETPLTIRHLYTHTGGLWDHWGDDLHDFDQLIGSYYPYLQVGKEFEYNGAGFAIGGKIIELVTGEAIPQYFQRHLLGPLGCDNLFVVDTSGGARSAPLDLAKIAQVLLNRGAYGDQRFFSEEAFAKMMPERLTKVLGPETSTERGIGVYHFRDDEWWAYGHAFSEEVVNSQVFGHGAASRSDLAIDPVRDSVIVMTRNDTGRNFEHYRPMFLAAVARACT